MLRLRRESQRESGGRNVDAGDESEIEDDNEMEDEVDFDAVEDDDDDDGKNTAGKSQVADAAPQKSRDPFRRRTDEEEAVYKARLALERQRAAARRDKGQAAMEAHNRRAAGAMVGDGAGASNEDEMLDPEAFLHEAAAVVAERRRQDILAGHLMLTLPSSAFGPSAESTPSPGLSSSPGEGMGLTGPRALAGPGGLGGLREDGSERVRVEFLASHIGGPLPLSLSSLAAITDLSTSAARGRGRGGRGGGRGRGAGAGRNPAQGESSKYQDPPIILAEFKSTLDLPENAELVCSATLILRCGRPWHLFILNPSARLRLRLCDRALKTKRSIA